MRYPLDFQEGLKDSPKFRQALEKAEDDIESLETKLEKMVKLCATMVDTGKAFNNATRGFVSGVQDLTAYFKDDDLTHTCLKKFSHAMVEMMKYFTILIDQAQRTVGKNLNHFVKTEIKKVKDTRKHFEKISDDMDSALVRNSQALRSKPQECEDAYNLLTATRTCFAHTSLDYIYQINILQSKKRFEVLDTMLSFVRAQSTYFHQGHELCQDFEPYMKDIASQVEELSVKASAEWKEMEERHNLVVNKDLSPNVQALPVSDEGSDMQMEGYLFKRTKHAFKSWVRRWFIIQQNQLVYQKRSKDHKATVMEEDLRLCTVKPVFELDRRFCFEVLSPARSHMLQADSEQECQAWINAIQNGVSKAYRDAEKRLTEQEVSEGEAAVTSPLKSCEPSNNPGKPQKEGSAPRQTKVQIRMEQLFAIPGNDNCCDCGASEPRWASINLGITLCIECSGIHRSFGVHMSKVRSITLDAWEPELLKVMAELGNNVVNRIYTANVDESIAKRATPDCNRTVREAWIRAKYVQKAFVNKLPSPKSSSSGTKAKGWIVKKKCRKSPSRSASKDEFAPSDTDVTSAVLNVSVSGSKDNDSGLGTSASDVIVFGTDMDLPDLKQSFDLDYSEDSFSESEEVEDNISTTSWEDMSRLDPNRLLYKAAQARNLPVMLEALANGALPNWVNEEDEGKTPLMKAVDTGSMAACEFLLLNGAKLDRLDQKGRTPLHHATLQGNTGQVCQFIKRGVNLETKDIDGKDALQIAIQHANADIVTLLRLAKLNEEMKMDDVMGNPGDETFNDVFRDFSNMASNNPEKLKRNHSQSTV
ncbi:hypothetical protein CHS0354_040376 [Potamilus streckersoni]|uniref:Arf-GAP with coiled-coil, ANK repeat and PH domain-containing protein 2-like n=1 Tax=Potamilus streckersoni TaxID=2493646 RepID=A0AAE0VMI7_9BIVA|nr:hypothetical protein CHS0354_040376 [Potamilus streckersoni]